MEASVDFAAELAEEVGEAPIDALPREIQAALIEAAESAHRELVPAPRSRWGEVSSLYRELTEDWRRGRVIQLESAPDRFTLDDARLFVSPRFKLLSALSPPIAIDILLAYAQRSALETLFGRSRVILEPGDSVRFEAGTLLLAHDEGRWEIEFLRDIWLDRDGVYAINFADRALWGLNLEPSGRFAFVSRPEEPNFAKHLLLYGIAERMPASYFDPINAPPEAHLITRARWHSKKRDKFSIRSVVWTRYYGTEVLVQNSKASIFDERGRELTIAEIVKRIPRSWTAKRKYPGREDAVRFLDIGRESTYAAHSGHLRIYNVSLGEYLGASDGSDTPSDLFFAQSGGSLRVWMPAPALESESIWGVLLMPYAAFLKKADASAERQGRTTRRSDQYVGEFEVRLEPEVARLPSADIRLLQPHRALFLPDDISDEDLRRLAFLQDPSLPARAEARIEEPPIVPL